MAVECTNSEGGAMPEFTTVSVQEAQLRTIPGRQGQVINEYADYIQRSTTGFSAPESGEQEEESTPMDQAFTNVE
jgi:hypothetical protein